MSTARGRVIGSTIRNIVETRLMVTGEQRISLEATTGSNPAAVIAPALELVIVQAAVQARVIALGVGLVLAIVLAVVLVLVIDQVAALELRIVRVAEELVLDPVVVELARVQAEAVPLRDHPHDRLAVLPKTKSVIVPHHRGRAVVLAAEDLAAVAETTREPAAAEAVAAWAAAE
jgi:hypothetical protein